MRLLFVASAGAEPATSAEIAMVDAVVVKLHVAARVMAAMLGLAQYPGPSIMSHGPGPPMCAE